MGEKELVNNDTFIVTLKSLAMNAEFIITVCTGSMLLFRTGILMGRRATSNKRLFDWTKLHLA